jgi:antitoxin component HigA of HigAB toxin-antitoxin module
MTNTTYHIKPYLRKRGFNLSALAKSMGMSFQRFDHHLKPKDDLSLNFVNELSKAIDVPVEDFISEVKIESVIEEVQEESKV